MATGDRMFSRAKELLRLQLIRLDEVPGRRDHAYRHA